MSKELKPCPFCGSKPCVWELKGKWQIGCNIEICPVSRVYTGTHLDRVDAVKAWNTRPALDGDKDLVEALEGIVETDYIEGYEGCISMATEALKKYKEKQ